MTTARITWIQCGDYHREGYVGTNGPLFAAALVRNPEDTGGLSWLLATSLPGLEDRWARNADADALKPTAEGWLGEFMASIGATFTDQGEGNTAT
jgi:hypothetical protein